MLITFLDLCNKCSDEVKGVTPTAQGTYGFDGLALMPLMYGSLKAVDLPQAPESLSLLGESCEGCGDPSWGPRTTHAWDTDYLSFQEAFWKFEEHKALKKISKSLYREHKVQRGEWSEYVAEGYLEDFHSIQDSMYADDKEGLMIDGSPWREYVSNMYGGLL